jgi:alanine dehydrogenase
LIIGVPREIKSEEYRVGITPTGVGELKKDGHTILIEEGAGEGSGFSDDEYLEKDADIIDRATLFDKADLIVKVKEPLPPEYDLLREGQTLFTFLHLAANRELAELLLNKKITGFSYETLQKDGVFPILSPMSVIAGRMAPIIGSYYLQRIHGGTGVLPAGAFGIKPAKTLILGAGVVGTNAALVSTGIGMDTVVINKGIEKLKKIDEMFPGKVRTLTFTIPHIKHEIREADIIIGAVLVPGGRTPVLITRNMLKTMKKGSVIVDVSVDQGGCAETTRPTTHDKPVYTVEGIIHYAVANMPGAYPWTATLSLTNISIPYIKLLACMGIERSIREDHTLRTALNTYRGYIVHEQLADSLGITFRNVNELII